MHMHLVQKYGCNNRTTFSSAARESRGPEKKWMLVQTTLSWLSQKQHMTNKPRDDVSHEYACSCIRAVVFDFPR